jgi:cation diffusion facilitator family transporter
MSANADSKKVVVAALAGNLAIAACKFAAAYLSHSTATLAEAVHSLADTGNQALLLIGMRLAVKPVSEQFAFGRSGEKYFWPFVVALMLFSVGGAFGIYEGISHMLGPAEEEHGSRLWSYGVLGVSLVFEALSFRVAYQEFKVMAKGKSIRDAIRDARDPTIPLVLAEDTTALLGLVIAFIFVLCADVFKLRWLDPLGSMLIGLLLALVAVVLAKVTHRLLIGTSATAEEQGEVLWITEQVPGVDRVTQLLTMHVGPEVVILAMKIAFRSDMKVEEVEGVIDEVERRVRKKVPNMRKIFLEPDSKGDGRGLDTARKAFAKHQASASEKTDEGEHPAEPQGTPENAPDSTKTGEA